MIAGIAQSVEQLIRNQQVVCSSHIASSSRNPVFEIEYRVLLFHKAVWSGFQRFIFPLFMCAAACYNEEKGRRKAEDESI